MAYTSLFRCKVQPGDRVEFVAGRKVAHGSKGFVFWIGPNKFDYGRSLRIGVKLDDGSKVFTSPGNVDRIAEAA